MLVRPRGLWPAPEHRKAAPQPVAAGPGAGTPGGAA
jgi:hypothetical protein